VCVCVCVGGGGWGGVGGVGCGWGGGGGGEAGCYGYLFPLLLFTSLDVLSHFRDVGLYADEREHCNSSPVTPLQTESAVFPRT